MLTKKQKQLLDFIYKRVGEGDVVPSYDEMKQELGLRSKSGIHRLISGLEERGFIKRLPHKARAIEICKMPNVVSFTPQETKRIEDEFQPVIPAMQMTELPLYGKIAAGTPIEALRNNTDFVSVPPDLIGRGEYYALTVEGDSMIEAGIHDGDTVIIERSKNIREGDIVVALVDDLEVTLKTYYRRDGKVALQPANKNYETRFLTPERVQFQGRLSGLIRRY